jgi:type I restriction enzyme S subunit
MVGDVLVSTKGTVGRVACVPEGFPEHVYSPQLCFLRAEDDAVLHPKWLYYWARSSIFLNQVAIYSGQTDMAPYLSLRDLSAISISIPPIAEQRRIAGVLGALDDLIEVNRGLVRDLDELRQVASEALLQDAKDSIALSTAAGFVNGKNFTKEAAGQGRPVIRTPELRQGPNQGTVWTDTEAADDFIANPGDILFVWSGSLMIDRWVYQQGLINQHIFKVVPQGGLPDWLVFAQIEHQMSWFRGLAADKATTMGHIQRGHLDAEVPLPDAQALAEGERAIAPLWNAQLQLRLEMLELASARDEILPLLMSGRVRVSEVVAA